MEKNRLLLVYIRQSLLRRFAGDWNAVLFLDLKMKESRDRGMRLYLDGSRSRTMPGVSPYLSSHSVVP